MRLCLALGHLGICIYYISRLVHSPHKLLAIQSTSRKMLSRYLFHIFHLVYLCITASIAAATSYPPAYDLPSSSNAANIERNVFQKKTHRTSSQERQTASPKPSPAHPDTLPSTTPVRTSTPSSSKPAEPPQRPPPSKTSPSSTSSPGQGTLHR